MKNQFFTTAIAIFTFSLLALSEGMFAQVPEKLNYQGIARDNIGVPLANQALGVRISILNDDGTEAYVETHGPTTNEFGLYTLAIGEGNAISGMMQDIDWAGDAKSLKLEIDPAGGGNYTDLGTTELLSTPYALFAANGGGLVRIKESSHPGYRRSDANPDNYGAMGSHAVDLSSSTTPSATRGATGIHTLATGHHTTASGPYSTAVGHATTASWYHCTAMGSNTTASGYISTSMGSVTTASGDYSTSMGALTTASGEYSTAMGRETIASGNHSTAMGRETGAGGNHSTAMGWQSFAIGNTSFAMGYLSSAYGNYSSAMGRRASAEHTDSFVINTSTNNMLLTSTAAGQMSMKFYGGYRFFTNNAGTVGTVLPPGANSWFTASDSTKKENYLAPDGHAFLQKIKTMRLGSWNYIGQDPGTFRHYGPMAQEFYACFGTDEIGTIGNDTTIATADIDGVMMIAIQALIEENESLKTEVSTLENRLNRIEAVLMKEAGPEMVNLPDNK